MATENVDIAFRATGIPTIKRQLDELGNSADRLTRGVFLLQRALFTLGGTAALAGLMRQLDVLTNLENRLKLVTTSTAQLNSVMDGLFRVSEQSRTSFETTGQIYTRSALALQNYGVTQQQVLDFTESLNKATILSGASAREANAALIQLSQGLGAGRLNGEELQSVLEQLPYVARIIADEMGVPVTALKKLGSEGKITTEIILNAMTNAGAEIDRLFAQTIPTIGQSFEVLRTNWLAFLKEFNDTTGIANKVAQAVLVIAKNIDLIVYSALALSALWATTFAVNAVNMFTASLRAVAAGFTATRAAAQLDAAARVASLRLKSAEAAENLIMMQQAITMLGIQQAQTRAEIVRGTIILQNMRALQSMGVAVTGLTAQENALAAARANLARIDAAILVTESNLLRARTLNTVATAQYATAINASNVATAANGTFLARMAAQYPLLGGALVRVTALFGSFSALLFSNPYTAVIAGLSAAAFAVFMFGDQVQIGSNKMVNLQDVVLGAVQVIYRAVSSLGAQLWAPVQAGIASVTPVLNSLVSVFSQSIQGIYMMWRDGWNFIIGVTLGGVDAIGVALTNVPAAFELVAVSAANLFVAAIEWMAGRVVGIINGLLTGINAVAELAGLGGIDLLSAPEFSRMQASGAASDLGGAMADAFGDRMGTNYVGDIGNAIAAPVYAAAEDNAFNRFDDARRAGIAGQATMNTPGDNSATAPGAAPGGGGGGGGGAGGVSFEKIVADMYKEAEGLKMLGREREIYQGILKAEEQLKRSLSATEKEAITAAIDYLAVSREAGSVLEELRGPQEAMQLRLDAINMLMQEGRITADEYAQAMRGVAASTDFVTNTIGGGFANGINRVIAQVDELGKGVSEWVVGAFGMAADAITEFAKSGQIDVKQLFQDIFANLLKLATNQLFAQLLSSFMGPAGAAGGSIFSSLFGFAKGGSIPPSGNGNTDSQLVAFKKRPDERVDILTPQQQRMQSAMMSGGGSNVTVTPTPVNVAVVLSEDDVVNAFSGQKGQQVIVRGVEKNKSSINKVLRS